MKKFILISLTILLSLTLSNCLKTIDAPYITVDTDELPAFNGTGGEQQIEFVTNYKWIAFSDQLWCTVSSESGKSGKSAITVTVSANTTTSARTATITINANGIQEYVTITQEKSILYSITMTKDGNGTVSSNHDTAIAGTSITIAAAPGNGNVIFKEWIIVSGNATLSSTTTATATFSMPAGNVEIKAVFESTIKTITMSNDGNGIANAYPATAAAGKSIDITATPKSGYKFKQWVVVSGNVTLSNTTKSPTNFTMPSENVEIKAEFEPAE